MRTDRSSSLRRLDGRRTAARISVTLTALAALWVSMPRPALAQQADAGPAIVEQRLPDGRTVLTDRPIEGAQTVRRWQFDAPDPRQAEQAQAERERRAEAARERDERLTRLVEQARATEAKQELERLRAWQRSEQRQAERERQAEAAPPLIPAWPVYAHAPYWRPPPVQDTYRHSPAPRPPSVRLHAPAR